MVVVIFDWDGTLSNSTPGMLEDFGAFSMKHFSIDSNTAKKTMIDHLGEKFPAHILRVAALVNKELSEDELSALVKEGVALSIKKFMAAQLFPEVINVLSELKDCGYDLCVSSGRVQKPLIRDVKGKGLNHYFKFILGTRDGFHKGDPHFNFISDKLSVKPREMVFVGDGPYDMMVGKKYGCFTIGRVDQVDAKTLISAGADTIIKNLRELPKIIKENMKVD